MRNHKHLHPSLPPTTIVAFHALCYPREEGYSRPEIADCFHFVLSSKLPTSRIQTSFRTCKPIPPSNTEILFCYTQSCVSSCRKNVRRDEGRGGEGQAQPTGRRASATSWWKVAMQFGLRPLHQLYGRKWYYSNQ